MFKNLKKLSLVKIFKLQGRERQVIYAVVFALFIVLNLLVSGLSLRYDASFGQAYTLSDSTKKILRNLDDIVNIKFFASSDLPTRLIPLKADVTDLLSEYKKEGKNNVQLKVLDPKKDQSAATEAREAGVPELQFSQLERDKYAVTATYFGIVLSYSGKSEVLPQVTELESLEYNLTASIYKLVRKELVKIGMLGYEDSFDTTQDKIANLRKILSQQFDIENLNISSESTTKSIDASFKTVLVFDTNAKKYDDNELKLLKAYLEKKGKAIFFVDGVWVSESLTTSAADHSLFSLLKEYGIKIEKNLVLSTSAELVNFGDSQISLLLPYPFWIRTNNFNQKVSYLSNVYQLTYPWVSSLRLEKKKDIVAQASVKTSNRSWEQKDNFVLNPQTITPPQEKDFKEFIVGAESTKKNAGKIIVIPSSRFVLDRYLSTGSDNLGLVLNIVNNLASGGALSGVRSRAVNFYPLPDLPVSQKDIFKYVNILMLPALFSLWGVVRLIKRR